MLEAFFGDDGPEIGEVCSFPLLFLFFRLSIAFLAAGLGRLWCSALGRMDDLDDSGEEAPPHAGTVT